MDLNDRFGLASGSYAYDSVVGPCRPDPEGKAAQLMRRVLGEAFVALAEALHKHPDMPADVKAWAAEVLAGAEGPEKAKDLLLLVRTCRLSRTYKGLNTKVIYHVSDDGSRRMLLKGMAAAKADHRVGRFPPMCIELVVESLLDNLDDDQ